MVKNIQVKCVCVYFKENLVLMQKLYNRIKNKDATQVNPQCVFIFWICPSVIELPIIGKGGFWCFHSISHIILIFNSYLQWKAIKHIVRNLEIDTNLAILCKNTIWISSEKMFKMAAKFPCIFWPPRAWLNHYIHLFQVILW